MTTRRERLERKLEKRAEWQGKAEAKARVAFKAGDMLFSQIPLGQPILIGHHSEKRHRRHLDRAAGQMDKGCEMTAKAKHHAEAAAGLATQLDNTVFSDDPDAIEALEARIAEREADCERTKAINTAWKKAKGDVERFKTLSGASDALVATITKTMSVCPWLRVPFDLTNTRASIRRDKLRVEAVKLRQKRTALAEERGILVEGNAKWVRLTFPEFPGRHIVDALKAAGFSWGSGSWSGERDKMPAEVAAMRESAIARAEGPEDEESAS